MNLTSNTKSLACTSIIINHLYSEGQTVGDPNQWIICGTVPFDVREKLTMKHPIISLSHNWEKTVVDFPSLAAFFTIIMKINMQVEYDTL